MSDTCQNHQKAIDVELAAEHDLAEAKKYADKGDKLMATMLYQVSIAEQEEAELLRLQHLKI